MGRAWGLVLFSVLLGCSKSSSSATPEPVKLVASVPSVASQPSAPTVAVDDLPDNYAGRTTANYADASAAQRELGIRQCVDKGDACHKGTLEGIAASTKSDNELAHLNDVRYGEMLSEAAKTGTDGDLSAQPIGVAAGILANAGSKSLTTLPTTSVAAAKKDPLAERGKVINVTGNVVEIQANHLESITLYEGSIITDSGAIIRFECPLATDGIVENSWVRYRGVFVQEYDYPNVAGGQTKSLLLVGTFNP